MDQDSTQNDGGAAPQVHTYHCICTNLLFAGTRALSDLPQRSGGLDKAYILALPPLSRASNDDQPSESEDEARTSATSASDYATLAETTLDRKPLIIRREDGFEKRYLQRCGRCRVVVGYHLDWAQYPEGEGTGQREDVVYLLPGGLLSTEEMVEGKDMSRSIALGGG